MLWAQLPSLLLASVVAQAGGSFFLLCKQLCNLLPVQIYCANELHSHVTTVLIPTL